MEKKDMTIEEYIEFSKQLNGGKPTELIGPNGKRVEFTVELYNELQEEGLKLLKKEKSKQN